MQQRLSKAQPVEFLEDIRKMSLAVNLDNEAELIEVLQAAVSCTNDLAEQLCRFRSEANLKTVRSINLEEYLNVSMQQVWFVTAALDRTFCAHVLASHLDPTYCSNDYSKFIDLRR